MRKIRVAYIEYEKREPSTGIGNVCMNLGNVLSKSEKIHLVKLMPPNMRFGKSVLGDTLNKVIFEFWRRFICPINIIRMQIDIYIEMNMLLPKYYLCEKVYFVHDAAFYMYQDHVTKKNYRKRMNLINNIKKNDVKILTNSFSTKNDLMHFFGIESDRMDVCHLAASCDIESGKKKLPDYDGYFLYVGTIEPRKNIIELIRAFEKFLRVSTYKYKLIIVGKKGWMSHEVCKVLEQHKNIVEVIGYVSNYELAEWYKGARALVYPSLYEGFGLPILEAMKYRTPVITCDNSSLREVAGDAALYCKEDAISIAKAMLKIANDQGLCTDLISRGIDREKMFTWEDFGESVVSSLTGTRI